MDNIDLIVDYIKSGEKEKGNNFLGLEFEHLILQKDGRAVCYFDDGGARDILNFLVDKKGFNPIFEGDNILGAQKEDYAISIEPGGQLELSLAKKDNLPEIEKEILDFYKIVVPEVESYGNSLYALSFQPVSDIYEYKILPKERYHAMFDYFGNHGSMSRYMMKATASVQCSIDYMNEADYSSKYGMATRLSNVLYALFDNAAFRNNRPLDMKAFRAYIWENTDAQRTGVLKKAFRPDFGYTDYAQAIMDVTAIFAYKKGHLERFDGTIGEALKFDSSQKSIEQLLSMMFLDVRTKKIMEIRMIDAIPYPYNLGSIALIKNIFYNENNLYRMWNLFGDMTYKEHVRSREDMYKNGARTKIMGKTIARWGEEILSGLDIAEEDKKYVESIVPIFTGDTLRDRMLSSYHNDRILANAIEISKVKIN
ncbi:MAG: glutamate-cysteine ligase family protein [Ezakiella sp.]|nr:glutamate-cysteine ligase family protein [Ezakiella sp.]MDD7471380.1 glutamate-cysteine ligase family protein [Bacillota bacterium]MDY3922877.1 glutamate-cysteine ligase family protein [Ezakiella sp.]